MNIEHDHRLTSWITYQWHPGERCAGCPHSRTWGMVSWGVFLKRLRIPLQDIQFFYLIQFDVIFLHVGHQFICAEYFGNFIQLIKVIRSMEEGFTNKYLNYLFHKMGTIPANKAPNDQTSKL